MSSFPFKVARPKGSGPPKQPSMSFELPAPPPATEPEPEPSAPEVQFEQSDVYVAPGEPDEQEQEQEEDVAKKRKRGPGRPKNPVPTPRPRAPAAGPKVARFTFTEVLSVIGEGEPVLKVVSKITPVIEILKPDDRKRVVDILARLYG